MKDPIVEEMRKQRLEHTRKFKGDLKAFGEDLRKIQKASGHEVVRLAPRKLQPSAKSATLESKDEKKSE